jgi:hypothetical protein
MSTLGGLRNAGRCTSSGHPPVPGNDHWRAVCGQSRLHGSGGGRRKRTQSTGTSPAAYLTLTTHLSVRMRTLIAARAWLTVIRLPAYVPDPAFPDRSGALLTASESQPVATPAPAPASTEATPSEPFSCAQQSGG